MTNSLIAEPVDQTAVALESLADIDARERALAAEHSQVTAKLAERRFALAGVEADLSIAARYVAAGSHEAEARELHGRRADLQMLIDAGTLRLQQLADELGLLEDQRNSILESVELRQRQQEWVDARADLVHKCKVCDQRMADAVSALADSIAAFERMQRAAVATSRAVPSRCSWSLALSQAFTSNETILRTLGVSFEVSIAKAAAGNRQTFRTLVSGFEAPEHDDDVEGNV